MNTPEQEEEARRDDLVNRMCDALNAGQPRQPATLFVRERPVDQCPSCERTMQWFEGRKAFICVHCQEPKL